MLISALIKSFILVFAAEMGDKTQAMTMAIAQKYRIDKIILGILLASVLNYGLAIGVAYFISSKFNTSWLQLITAFLFFIFSFNVLKKELFEEKAEVNQNRNAIFAVFGAFFVGEIGNKTQLAVIGLGLEGALPVYILIGAVLAMVLVSFLAVLIGRDLFKKVPEAHLKILSSLIFFSFFALKYFESGLTHRLPQGIFYGLFLIAGLLYFFALKSFLSDQKLQHVWQRRERREMLYNQDLSSIFKWKEIGASLEVNEENSAPINDMLSLLSGEKEFGEALKESMVARYLQEEQFDKEELQLALSQIMLYQNALHGILQREEMKKAVFIQKILERLIGAQKEETHL